MRHLVKSTAMIVSTMLVGLTATGCGSSQIRTGDNSARAATSTATSVLVRTSVGGTEPATISGATDPAQSTYATLRAALAQSMSTLLHQPDSTAAQRNAKDSSAALRLALVAGTTYDPKAVGAKLSALESAIALLSDPNQTVAPPGTTSQLSRLTELVISAWDGAQIALYPVDTENGLPPPTSTRASSPTS